jgi:hypothetical protein
MSSENNKKMWVPTKNCLFRAIERDNGRFARNGPILCTEVTPFQGHQLVRGEDMMMAERKFTSRLWDFVPAG